jgi:hypothetical protein
MKKLCLLGVIALMVPFTAFSQGPVQRLGQGLDQMGKNIRRTVDQEIDRGQVVAADRGILNRVYHRLHWDTALINANLQFVVRTDNAVILRGSVADLAAKKRALDLAQTTFGVTAVIDELVVGSPTAAPILKPSTVAPEPGPTIIIPPVAADPAPSKP